MWSVLDVEHDAGTVKRRRERRLRQFLPLHGDRRWPGVGSGYEMHYTATLRKNPPSQEPGTRYFGLDDDDSVPELGGSRPDRLISVSGPQEWVQRHTVEQIIDTFASVPMLDALVLLVEQLVEVLQIADTSAPDVEQVIDVPKIALEDGTPVARRAPRAAGGGAVRGCASAADGHPGARQGRTWHPMVPRCGEGERAGPTVGWWAAITPSGTAQRDSPLAQGGVQILGAAIVDKTVDVPNHAVQVPAVRDDRHWLCLIFSSSTECWTFQLCHREREARRVPNCAENWRLHSAVLGMLLTRPSLCNDLCRGWSRQC